MMISVVEHVRVVSNYKTKNFRPALNLATTQVVISRLARLISNLDLIDRDVIHECSCSDSWLEPKNLIFLFGPVPKPEFGLSLIIRITWISGSRGSLGSYYMYLQLDHVIRECIIRKTVRSLFWNCSRTAWIVKIVKLPGVWKSFFLESNIFLIKMRIFLFV